MTEQRLAPRHVTPYLVSGATGLHILVRMWRLSRLPASNVPLHAFLLNHADVLLVLGSGPVVVWQIARRQHLQRLPTESTPSERSLRTLITRSAHELRQVFTALLIGLGLIRRKVMAGKTREIPRVAQRLQHVVRTGIEAVNTLDPPASFGQRELAVNED
jgi:hypothetical protein